MRAIILKVSKNFLAVMFSTKIFYRQLPHSAGLIYDIFKNKFYLPTWHLILDKLYANPAKSLFHRFENLHEEISC